MRKRGSARSRPRLSAEAALATAVATVLLASAGSGARVVARADEMRLRPYVVAGDAIEASLTGLPGDPARGRTIVINRRVGLCLLCHTGPFPEEKFQGNIGPDLGGAGSRWSEGQLRLRLVDPGQINPSTVMPPYYRVDGLVRVAPAVRGKPVLSAEEIEDVVAFLTTLRD